MDGGEFLHPELRKLTYSCNRTSPLISMMKDQFANYVVQKMLDVVDGDQREVLVSKIKPHLQSLKKYTYGKHLISSELLCPFLGRRRRGVTDVPLCDFFVAEVEKMVVQYNLQ